MSRQSTLKANGESQEFGAEISPWRTLFGLARPFRARILIIIMVAALSTAATLIEPLIYRVAVNDVAGLFVGKAQEQTEQEEEDLVLQEPESPITHFQQVRFQTREPHVPPAHKLQRHEKNTKRHATYVTSG